MSADGPIENVAIDIPLGLSDTGRRPADDCGPAPGALPGPAAARISVQAFALRIKLLQVDAWVNLREPASWIGG